MLFKFVLCLLGEHFCEYAKWEMMARRVEKKRIRVVKVIPAEVPTGCNELVFEKEAA